MHEISTSLKSISINELNKTTYLAPAIIVKFPEVVAYLFRN
jgi:hypothetical protein